MTVETDAEYLTNNSAKGGQMVASCVYLQSEYCFYIGHCKYKDKGGLCKILDIIDLK